MYHGGSWSGTDDFMGDAWFTSDRSGAAHYAKQIGGNIKRAYLIVKNPLYSGDLKNMKIKMTPSIAKKLKVRNNTNSITIGNDGYIKYLETNAAVLLAKDLGFDGVIDIENNKILDVVVFSPRQIVLK